MKNGTQKQEMLKCEILQDFTCRTAQIPFFYMYLLIDHFGQRDP